MRYFLYIGIILLYFVSGMQGRASAGTMNSNIAAGTNASVDLYILSPASVNYNYMATKGSGSNTLPSVFSVFLKSQFTGYALNEARGALSKSDISHYIFYSEYHIPRFEGVEIIYPFSYFW